MYSKISTRFSTSLNAYSSERFNSCCNTSNGRDLFIIKILMNIRIQSISFTYNPFNRIYNSHFCCHIWSSTKRYKTYKCDKKLQLIMWWDSTSSSQWAIPTLTCINGNVCVWSSRNNVIKYNARKNIERGKRKWTYTKIKDKNLNRLRKRCFYKNVC